MLTLDAVHLPFIKCVWLAVGHNLMGGKGGERPQFPSKWATYARRM